MVLAERTVPALCALAVLSSLAPAQEPTATIEDGNVLEVTAFELEYRTPRGDQIPPEVIIQNTVVSLFWTNEGYVAPRPGQPGEPIRLADVPKLPLHFFFNSAIKEVQGAVVRQYESLSQIVVLVITDPGDINPEGYSVRPPGRTHLRLLVWSGRATEIRTVATGNRFSPEKRSDHQAHRRIKEHSPIQVNDLIWKDKLETYVHILNRQPGRRVDVALSKAPEEDGVVLDYLVNENKPWFVYGEGSNTGTKTTTAWRERFGFVHNQLTNRDDILSLQYITGGFKQVHTFVGAYDAPIWGLKAWRWQVAGNWGRFDASDVGQFQEKFSGEQWTAGGLLVWNALQYRDFFLDLFAGARWQDIRVDTESTGIVGQDGFFLPRAGLRVEQWRQTFRTLGSADVERNISSVARTDAATLDQLGRIDPEDDFTVAHWAFYHAHYLEPLLFGDQREKPESRFATLAHEVALQFDGQSSFGDRLIPQQEQVVGGLYTVRGYPESVTAGDTVLNARFDYQFHVPQAFPPSTSPPPRFFFDKPFRLVPQQAYGRADWDLILRAFIDAGRAINSHRKSFEKDETLVGTGVGAELLIKQNFRVRFDWGIALTEVSAGGNPVERGDNRFHFLFTVLF